MRFKLLSPFILVLSLSGCQSIHQKPTSKHVSNKLKSKAEKNLPKVKEFERPHNIFADQHSLENTISQDAILSKGPVELSEKEKIFFELSGEKIENLSEIETYYKAVEKYQQSDEVGLNAYSNLILKKYPRSIYCDNVLYFKGMLAFSQKKYGESLTSFQKILSMFPQGNKAVSALFAKGIVFKKMNLNSEAVRLLARVVNQYPGSPESARAQVELKLITQ